MDALLKAYILQRYPACTIEELAIIAPYFEPQMAKRNEMLLSPGEFCKHYYFVLKGGLRLFAINEQGEEGTRYFAFEGSFGTALPSLITQEPAFEYLQAIESTELLAVTSDDFYYLVNHTLAFGSIYRQILEAAFITAQKRIYGFQGLDAMDQLKWVLQYQPNILNRVSNKLVASYLGINPATLSRLKAKL